MNRVLEPEVRENELARQGELSAPPANKVSVLSDCRYHSEGPEIRDCDEEFSRHILQEESTILYGINETGMIPITFGNCSYSPRTPGNRSPYLFAL